MTIDLEVGADEARDNPDRRRAIHVCGTGISGTTWCHSYSLNEIRELHRKTGEFLVKFATGKDARVAS